MVGLTSFGSGCAKPGFPDVFMRISHYKELIRNFTVVLFKGSVRERLGRGLYLQETAMKVVFMKSINTMLAERFAPIFL